MIFATPEWGLVERAQPLVSLEVKHLRASIYNSALDLHWLINWAEAAKHMIARSVEEKDCPDYHYQLNRSK